MLQSSDWQNQRWSAFSFELNSFYNIILFTNLLIAVLFFNKQSGGLSAFQTSAVLSLVILLFAGKASFVMALDTVERSYIALCLLVALTWIANGGIPQENIEFFKSIGGNTENIVFRATIHAVLALLILIFGYKLAKRFVRNANDAIRALWWVIMTLSSASAITVLAWLTETGGLVSRYNFTSPISKSQFIAPYVSGIGALLAVCIGMNAGMSRQRKLLLQIALLILGLSTIIVMSRTVFIINVITFFIYIVLSFKNSPRRQRKVIRVIGLLVSVVLGIFLFTSDLLDAFISLGDAEDLGILNRATMVKQALYVFAEHPFLGVGFGYETLYLTEPILYRGEAQFLSSVHNGLASLLLQWGLVGMLVYTFFIARITRFFYRGWKLAAHPFCRAMCALSLSLIGADIANMVVGQNMVIPIMQAALVQTSFILWVLFGITAGLIRLETVKQ